MWTVRDAETRRLLPHQTLSMRALTAGREIRDREQLLTTILRSIELRDPRWERVLSRIPTWLNLKEEFEGLYNLGLLREAMPFRQAARIDAGEQGPDFDISIDDEFVLVLKDENTVTMEFEYTEPDRPAEQIQLRPDAEVKLELFGLCGYESVETEGSQSMPRGPGGFRRATQTAMFKAAALVGRVVRVAFNRPASEKTDVLAAGRVDDLEAKHPALRDAIPRLIQPPKLDPSYLPPGKRFDELVVLVHGTMSCGMRLAAAIYPSPKSLPTPAHKKLIVRYEHDTFLPCHMNTKELVSWAGAFTGRVPHLLFLAHSRGGLVAAGATEALCKTRLFKSVSIHTYGTPHAGTPLVNEARGVAGTMEAHAKAGARIAAEAMSADVLGWAAGFGISRLAKLPEGILDMRPNNSYILQSLERDFSACAQAMAWAGEFDPTASDASGYAHAAQLGFQSEAFDRRDLTQFPNDGVVPSHSAFASKLVKQAPFANCDHSALFTHHRHEIQLRIEAKPPS